MKGGSGSWNLRAEAVGEAMTFGRGMWLLPCTMNKKGAGQINMPSSPLTFCWYLPLVEPNRKSAGKRTTDVVHKDPRTQSRGGKAENGSRGGFIIPHFILKVKALRLKELNDLLKVSQ